MTKVSRPRSRFDTFLDELVQQDTDRLAALGWLDSSTGGPKVEEIALQLGPQEQSISDGLYMVLFNSYWPAAAHEARGSLPAAMGWYRLGQYMWRGGRQFANAMQDPPDMSARSAAGRNQFNAAICAERVGNLERAHQLYEWAAYNYTLSPPEMEWYARQGFASQIWDFVPFAAYSLGSLGRWAEARSMLEEADQWISKDRGAKTRESYQAPLRILPVVLALARHQPNPTHDSRREVRAMLQPQAVATRSHTDHLLGLFYLFNLRARYPDLAASQEKDALSPDGVRQAAELAQKWFARQGFTLDRTPESLKVIDQLMQQSYAHAPDEEARSGMIFLWGSYLGEVLRQELAGGQWDFESESRGTGVVWDMGVGELRVLPYKHVLQILTGKTSQSLFELWQETERSYIEMGLAAKHAE